MISRLVLLVLFAAASMACGGSSTPTASTEITTTYVRHCAGCHGVVGTEQFETSLPNLHQLDGDAVEAKIRFGGAQMPGFADTLTDEEIAAIADLVATS